LTIKSLIINSNILDINNVIEDVEIYQVKVLEITYNNINLNNINFNKINVVIFTTPISVDLFKMQVFNYLEFLNNKMIITIGNRTSKRLGLNSITIKKYDEKEIENYLGKKPIVLVVKAENSYLELIKFLEKRAKKVYVVNAYKNKNNYSNYYDVYTKLKNNYFDAIIFLSSQIFETYIDIFSYYDDPIEILPRYVVALGMNTAINIKKYEINPIISQIPDIKEGIKILKSMINNS